MSERSSLSAPHEIMQIDPEPCEDRQIIRAGDARAPQKGARNLRRRVSSASMSRPGCPAIAWASERMTSDGSSSWSVKS